MTEINITSLMIIVLAVFTIWTMGKRHAAEIKMLKGELELLNTQKNMLIWILEKRIPYISKNGKLVAFPTRIDE